MTGISERPKHSEIPILLITPYHMNPLKKAMLSAFMVSSLTVYAIEPYQDKSLPAMERADDLLRRLTLDEKISLMMDVSPAIDRLGIPEYNWWNEALHGVGRAGLATVFPQCIGLAATWDEQGVLDVYTAISDEARAKYNEARRRGDHSRYRGLTFWTPNVNIFRDPRWGRGQETYGEDPYLTSRLGTAAVKGLQGDPVAIYKKTVACAKHYAVHSGPEWNRHSFDAADIDPRDLRETYLPAFKALVDAGVGQVMCAYNRFEGSPCCSSNRLLHRILREEWGYDGIVVSDCGAISDFHVKGRHETHPDVDHAVADAVITGTDLECGSDYRHLGEAVRQGLINEADIGRSVRRLLVTRYELGEMDDDPASPWADTPMSVVDCDRHRQLARDMACKSIVLLKNNGILPLPHNAKVMVIGPNADNASMQWGNYNGTPSHTVTILDGIRLKSDSVRYEHACGHLSMDKADSCLNRMESPAGMAGISEDIVIFVGGISPAIEGEEMPVSFTGFRGGDRTSIELPAVQRDLLAELKAAGKKIVYVNCSGSAIGLSPESKICDAIVQAWYPGQEGGTAVADVLFGDYNPSGHLPVTFYADDSQLPDYEDYSMAGRTYRFLGDKKPLYPFGYGLSYTTFVYGKAKLSASKIKAGQSVSLYIPVKNTGSTGGDAVVQVYVRRVGDTAGPELSLKSFARRAIEPGDKQNVTIRLDDEAFLTFDNATGLMNVQKGKYEIMYGSSSAAEDLQSLHLTID